MNLIEQYKPLIKGNARKLAERFNMDKRDLEQEGNLMLWQIQERSDLGDNAKAISSYIRLRVIGAMQDYIAKNLGPVAVPKSAFWEKGETAQGLSLIEDYTDDFADIPLRLGKGTQKNPDTDAEEEGVNFDRMHQSKVTLTAEDELILKEEAIEFDMRVKALKATLTPKEIAVFDGIIMADEPMTTREMADVIDVNSPQTVVNIRERILNKWQTMNGIGKNR